MPPRPLPSPDALPLVAARDDLGALSIRDAAAALGVGRSTLYELIRDGEIRPVKIRSRTLVPVAQIRALLRRGTTR